MTLNSTVEFFGAYGKPPARKSNIEMAKKTFFLLLVGMAALSICGCSTAPLRSYIRDLEMENAALRAANEYLRDDRTSSVEKESLIRGRNDLLSMEQLAHKTACETDLEFFVNAGTSPEIWEVLRKSVDKCCQDGSLNRTVIIDKLFKSWLGK